MLIIRTTNTLNVRALAARSLFNSCNYYSKDYASSSDDEKEQKKKKPKQSKSKPESSQIKASENEPAQETAASRLNRLLSSMQTDDSYSLASKQYSVAKPGEGNKKIKQQAKETAKKKDIFVAAKRVAELLGDGDKKQTESELLTKLLGHSQQNITESNRDAANNVTSPDKANDLSLGELIVGMKIDRSPQPKETDTRADFVRRSIGSKKTQQSQQGKYTDSRGTAKQRLDEKRAPAGFSGSVNLFGSEPLGIFKDVKSLQESADILTTWAHLQHREFKLQVTHPPSNYFEKIALWTEQKKLWRFPINNEQDLPMEIVNEDFSEHIFFEQHLENWCPNKGPIRHFMELVCVGLSKNPYITAKEKKEHILWYRDYFMAKKDILRDLMSQEKLDKVIGSKKQVAES